MRKLLIWFLLFSFPLWGTNTQEVSQNLVNEGLKNLKQTLEAQEKMLEEEIKNKERLKKEAIRLIKSLSGKNFITFKKGNDIYIITFDNKTHNLAVLKENNPYLEQKLKPIKLKPARLGSDAPKGIKVVAAILGITSIKVFGLPFEFWRKNKTLYWRIRRQPLEVSYRKFLSPIATDFYMIKPPLPLQV